MTKTLLSAALLLFSLTSKADVPNQERLSLIAFFNSTNGTGWSNNENWNTSQPVSSWHGVVVTNINGTDHVTQINLPMNNLSGNLPNEIGNLSELTVCNVWNNQIAGTIPTTLGNCIKLKTLYLDNNQLSGQLPTSLSNLTQMEDFWVSFNPLNGDVTSIYTSWPNLIYLGLDNTQLTGDLNLSYNTNLNTLYVYNSTLSSINLQNNNNNQLIDFTANNSPFLSCVQVDNPQIVLSGAAPHNGWMVDSPSVYTVTCGTTNLDNTEIKTTTTTTFYPVPTTDYLYSSSTKKIVEVKLYDTLGKLIYSSKDETGITKTDISNLRSGVYFVNSLDDDGNSNVSRIIKS